MKKKRLEIFRFAQKSKASGRLFFLVLLLPTYQPVCHGQNAGASPETIKYLSAVNAITELNKFRGSLSGAHKANHPHAARDCDLLNPDFPLERFDAQGHAQIMAEERKNCPICTPRKEDTKPVTDQPVESSNRAQPSSKKRPVPKNPVPVLPIGGSSEKMSATASDINALKGELSKRDVSQRNNSGQNAVDTADEIPITVSQKDHTGRSGGLQPAETDEGRPSDPNQIFSVTTASDGTRIDPRFIPKEDGQQVNFGSPQHATIGAESKVGEVALVPGLQVSAADQAEYALRTVDSIGADIVLFHNKMQAFVPDVRTAGTESSRVPVSEDPRRTGNYQNAATLPLANWIEARITSGNNANIICHSEGEIIAGNAILEVKKHLIASGYSQDEASKTLGRIKVASFGGASDDTGQFHGVGSWRRVVHEDDPVPNHFGAGNNKSAYDLTYHSFLSVYLPSFSSDMFSESGTFVITTNSTLPKRANK